METFLLIATNLLEAFTDVFNHKGYREHEEFKPVSKKLQIATFISYTLVGAMAYNKYNIDNLIWFILAFVFFRLAFFNPLHNAVFYMLVKPVRKLYKGSDMIIQFILFHYHKSETFKGKFQNKEVRAIFEIILPGALSILILILI